VLKKRENKRKMIIFSEDHKVTERYKEVYGLKFLITDTQSTVDALPADSSVKVIFFHDDITANEINTVLLKEV